MQIPMDPVYKDMETMIMEEFAAKYCTGLDDGCDECDRQGVCCLNCRFRRDCQTTCDSEKERVKLDALSVEEFCQRLRDHDEDLLTFVAAEKIRTAENHIADLIIKHVKKCLSCEKLDLAVQVVELNGCLENIRNLMENDRQVKLQTMTEWLDKYNIPYDCGWRDAIDKLIAGGAEEKA